MRSSDRSPPFVLLLTVFAAISHLVALSHAVIIRDYNRVNFEETKTFDEFKSKYLYGENNDWLVRTNIVMGVASPECYDKLESPALRGAQRHSGGDVVASVIMSAEEWPFKLSPSAEDISVPACAEAFFYRKGTTLANPTSQTQDFLHRNLNRWVAERMVLRDYKMTNGFSFPIGVYWQEESQDPVYQHELQPGESFYSSSFIGHIFSASSHDPAHYFGAAQQASNAAAAAAAAPGEDAHPAYLNIVDFLVVDGSDYVFSPANRLETCELHQQEASTQTDGQGQLLALGPGHQLECDNMFLRLVEFTHAVWYSKRLGLNYVQPQFVEPVTANGFEHRQLPADTYRWLRQWYDSQKLIQEVTESSSGPCMNQHVAPSGVTHLTGPLKDRLSSELQETLEGWHGAPLELTSIYGIRKYTNGSVLRMHVDTVNTHVVSAIINVDQEVEDDWELLILDHDDNEHRLVMQPGDMVLYESAKLLHGRPEPFNGLHYDNIFIHYKPVSGWDYDWL